MKICMTAILSSVTICTLLLPLGCNEYGCPDLAFEGVRVLECHKDSNGSSCCTYWYKQCTRVVCSDTCYDEYDMGEWECLPGLGV